ncbi:hypothetical protein CBL_07283 [Carabus blaptoides fortunei]
MTTRTTEHIIIKFVARGSEEMIQQAYRMHYIAFAPFVKAKSYPDTRQRGPFEAISLPLRLSGLQNLRREARCVSVEIIPFNCWQTAGDNRPNNGLELRVFPCRAEVNVAEKNIKHKSIIISQLAGGAMCTKYPNKLSDNNLQASCRTFATSPSCINPSYSHTHHYTLASCTSPPHRIIGSSVRIIVVQQYFFLARGQLAATFALAGIMPHQSSRIGHFFHKIFTPLESCRNYNSVDQGCPESFMINNNDY